MLQLTKDGRAFDAEEWRLPIKQPINSGDETSKHRDLTP
jgi:hypothetical protein